MMFTELFVPRGALSEEQRRRVSEQLITEVIRADGAPATMIEASRALANVVVHERETWNAGGLPVGPGDAPRYMVRVTVPGGHLSDAMRSEMIGRITRVLANAEARHQRLYEEPVAWVHIVEVPDGNLGAFGRVLRMSDVMQLVMTGDAIGDEAPSQEPAGAATDPICGMTVDLNASALTLEHDGEIYGFCSAVCRDLFLGQVHSA